MRNQLTYLCIFFRIALLLLLSFNIATVGAQHQHGNKKSIERAWRNLGIKDTYHAGLSIYDLQKSKFVFNDKADNYFTPASNIKLLTMYAAVVLLEDQIDAAYYMETKDSIYLWGGGDPGSYYPDKNVPGPLADFIRTSVKPIVFADNHFKSTRYGKGWAWDDHPYGFQCERNAFPVYGNRMWIDRSGDNISVTPSYLTAVLKIKRDSVTKSGRSEWGDQYFYTYDPKQPKDHREIPITFFKNDLLDTWSEATGKDIYFSDKLLSIDARSLAGSFRDTLIKRMMQESDNFIAEQLLLSCSLKALRYMSDEDLIDSLFRGPFHDLADKIEWVDGSGLSRYNRMTPGATVEVLKQLIDLKGLDYMTRVLPAGGQSGTLQQFFKTKKGTAYMFAKSGSMSKVYCLSGLMYTRSGKVLLFSWMNNQYPGDTISVKGDMEKLFSFLYDHY